MKLYIKYEPTTGVVVPDGLIESYAESLSDAISHSHAEEIQYDIGSMRLMKELITIIGIEYLIEDASARRLVNGEMLPVQNIHIDYGNGFKTYKHAVELLSFSNISARE